MVILQLISVDSSKIVSGASGNDNLIVFLVFVFAIVLTSLIFILDNRSKKKKRLNEKLQSKEAKVESDKSHVEEKKLSTIPPEKNKQQSPPEEKKTIERKNSTQSAITKEPKITDTGSAFDIQINTTTSIQNVHKKPIVKVNPRTIFIEPVEEQRSQIKFIGYEPNNLFFQNEPYNFPYVVMPMPRSVIKFPRKNKIGNKGYAEDHFFGYMNKYFKTYFKIFNDRTLIISSKQNPYEPDIAIIDEVSGTNLFVDIEIDEPYDGITRQPLHFRGYDDERNNFFKNRGWLTIRFAEIQIWQHPESCCKFIYTVINSLNSKYITPSELKAFNDLEFIPQWTIEIAKEWAKSRYRENYLGKDSFVVLDTHKELKAIAYSEQENEIENHVKENEPTYKRTENINAVVVKQAINTGKYVSGKVKEDNTYTILQPKSLDGKILKCYCYLKNKEREIDIRDITDIIIRDQPFLVRINGAIGVDEIKRVVDDAIKNHKIVRMKYTRAAWLEQIVDEETGEVILNQIESEESVRTITNIDYSVNVLDPEHIEQYNLTSEGYITAYCHKREAKRTFRFDRINELEILNV